MDWPAGSLLEWQMRVLRFRRFCEKRPSARSASRSLVMPLVMLDTRNGDTTREDDTTRNGEATRWMDKQPISSIGLTMGELTLRFTLNLRQLSANN